MPATVFVLNGPNLNLLGTREPEIYGDETLDDIAGQLEDRARELDLTIDMRQSNHEGHLVDWIQEAQARGAKAVILNAGAFTHTSVAVHDAIKGVKTPVMERPVGIPEVFEEHARLMSDLMVVAFQTDMTRVITYMFAREGSNRAFPEVGVPEGCHVVTHHQNDPAKIAKAQIVEEHRAKSFAYLVKRMKEAEDGDGTLLDHVLIYKGSNMGNSHRHAHEKVPVVLVGGIDGTFKGNRHLVFPDNTQRTSNMLLSLLHLYGLDMDKFGTSTGRLQPLEMV